MIEFVKGRKILVTGGTGSIGQAIVRQLLELEPTAVRVLSRDETKQFELLSALGDRPDVRYLIGDVRDLPRLRRAMEGIDLVFHSAAMKHVPACEYNPFEAVKTNVLGVQNLIEAALEEQVDRVVAISTDKVANPCNTMGATKLLAERLIAAANYHKGPRRTVFTCVRFGNVLGSRGSVIPLFEQQIASGGPVTITDRRMTRFMMSVQDAAVLVLKAALAGRGGEVFILKMPVVRLVDLAAVAIEALAPRHGRSPDAIGLRNVGLRPGEKLHEELMTDEEATRAVETDDMFIIQPALRSGFNTYPGARPAPHRSYSSRCVRPLSRAEVCKLLFQAGLIDGSDTELTGRVDDVSVPADGGRYTCAGGL